MAGAGGLMPGSASARGRRPLPRRTQQPRPYWRPHPYSPCPATCARYPPGDLRIIDVESGEIHRTFKKTGRETEFLAVVERLASQFLTDLRLPTRMVAVAAPPLAVVLYSSGLDYERRSDRQRAAQLYRRALENFPDHADAAAALARIR